MFKIVCTELAHFKCDACYRSRKLGQGHDYHGGPNSSHTSGRCFLDVSGNETDVSILGRGWTDVPVLSGLASPLLFKTLWRCLGIEFMSSGVLVLEFVPFLPDIDFQLLKSWWSSLTYFAFNYAPNVLYSRGVSRGYWGASIFWGGRCHSAPPPPKKKMLAPQ